jgi:hypothetical protein
MNIRQFGFAATVAAVGWVTFASAAAADEHPVDSDAARIRRGFEIAPVPLNLRGKDRALVGLGSYLVNTSGCDDCHTASTSSEFAPGGNPYFKGNPPKVINQAAYLTGGRNFGSLIPGTPEIVSRNLTPDEWTSGRTHL